MPASSIRVDDVRAHTREPWPLPGGGDTRTRWSALETLAEHDLPLAKLVEPHHDAIAILTDLAAAPASSDDVWGVWAADPPFAVLTAEEVAGGWTVSGRKAFCSGAELVSHALVTARTAAGSRLFAIELGSDGIAVDAADHPWAGPGMARAGTMTLVLDGTAAEPIGAPGAYTDRPGFWWGAVGIAAMWLGGARGVARTIEQAAGRLDAHGLAHLGAVRAELDSMALVLDAAAARADDGTLEPPEVERLALVVRERAAAVVDTVIARVGRALGPAPLAFDAAHAARVADLQVFVRQHHAERDQERLGAWTRA